MDDQYSRDSHGSYGSRAPMDYSSGGSGAGILFAVIVLGAIVLGSFFIGSGGDPATDAVIAPAPEAGTTTAATGN